MNNKEHYPSLFLLASGHEAKWYVINGNKAELIHEFDIPKVTFSDKEGLSMAGGSDMARMGGTDLTSAKREQERDLHMKEIVERTTKYWQEKDYVHFCYALPSRFKNMFYDEVTKGMDKADVHYFEGNYTHSPLGKIPDLFLQCLRPKFEK